MCSTGSRSTMGRGNFRERDAHCKVYDFLRWAVQRTAEPIDLPFGLWILGWAEGSTPGIREVGANVASWQGTLALPGEYNWTAGLLRRCGLMPNYTLTTCYLLQVKLYTVVTYCRINAFSFSLPLSLSLSLSSWLLIIDLQTVSRQKFRKIWTPFDNEAWPSIAITKRPPVCGAWSLTARKTTNIVAN